MIYFLIFALGGILASVAGFALRQRTMLGALVALQCAYLSISYIGRPIFLLVLNPAPRLNDAVADPRMASLGYRAALEGILDIVLLGVVVFAVCSAFILRMDARRSARAEFQIDFVSCCLLLAFGWMLRLATIYYSSDLLTTFSLVASVGMGALLLFHFQRFTHPRSLIVLFAVVGSELAWSFYTTTKAPIFAVGLMLFLLILRDFTFSAKKAASVALVGLGLLSIFPIVQEAKVAAGRMDGTASVTSSYPAVAQSFLPVVKRFDLVSAGMDAISAGSGSWISPLDALQHIGRSFVPSVLLSSDKSNSGALWAVEVRGQTVADSNTGVHLAEGPIAEGYVISGRVGIVVESLAMSLATALVAFCLRSPRPLLTSLGILMLSQPYLFERGVLGLSEGLGKGIQAATIAWLLLWIVSILRGEGRPQTGRQTDVSGTTRDAYV